MMHLFSSAILGTAMFAADAPAAAPSGDPRGLLQLAGPLVIFGVIFYFMLIRPQQKKAKEHQALMSSLKPKDKIVTSGGLYGEVISLKEKTVSVRCGEAKLEIMRSAVSDVVERGQGESKS